MSRDKRSGPGKSWRQKTDLWRKLVKAIGKRKHRQAEREATNKGDLDGLAADSYKRAEDRWNWD